ncbi:MAG: hypothetical protein OXN84_22025 [Albidovulum sp.]|nr:hypothetical protein [Albidovulum sp.]
MSFAAVIFGAGHLIGGAFSPAPFSFAGALGIGMQISLGAMIPSDVLPRVPFVATNFRRMDRR